jgi:hypothetical protein
MRTVAAMGRGCVAVLLLAFVAGCGGGLASGDEGEVQTVVASYVRAAADGNGRQACAYYTPRLREEIDRKAKAAGLKGCTALLDSALPYRLSQLPEDVVKKVREAIEDPGKVDVDMQGQSALAAIHLPSDELTDTRVKVVHEGEDWRIDRLGVREAGG